MPALGASPEATLEPASPLGLTVSESVLRCWKASAPSTKPESTADVLSPSMLPQAQRAGGGSGEAARARLLERRGGEAGPSEEVVPAPAHWTLRAPPRGRARGGEGAPGGGGRGQAAVEGGAGALWVFHLGRGPGRIVASADGFAVRAVGCWLPRSAFGWPAAAKGPVAYMQTIKNEQC